MTFNRGFKALAYPATTLNLDPVSPCPCSLVFQCDAARKQATLLLIAIVPTSTDAETTFVLQYDADKLLSGSVRLTTGNARVPHPQVDKILRDVSNKHSDVKTLDLSINHPCPLWCPDTAPPFSPRPGHEPAFQQFADLAKATTIHILFDYKHLRKEHQGMFRAFSRVARGLVAYPVEASLVEQALRKASWEALGPVEAAGAPPAYEGSRTQKRSRQASPSSPAQPSKRPAPQSPTESHSSEKTIPFSPATAAEAFGRALQRASPGFDFQTDAINAAVDAAVERQLLPYLHKAQALQNQTIDAAVARQLPVYLNRALQAETVDVAVGKKLATVLPALLPNALESLLAPQPLPSSPSLSFASVDSRGNRYPKLPPLTPIGRAMIPHLRTHLTDEFQKHQAEQLLRFEKRVDKTLAQLESYAYDDRARETADFDDAMEEHKAEVSLLQRDTIHSLWRETEDVLGG